LQEREGQNVTERRNALRKQKKKSHLTVGSSPGVGEKREATLL